MSHASAQPHAVSTATTNPHTLQLYFVPFFIAGLADGFAAAFFAAGFAAAFFTAGFAAVFFGVVFVAIAMPPFRCFFRCFFLLYTNKLFCQEKF
jgi:hypothetical protein